MTDTGTAGTTGEQAHPPEPQVPPHFEPAEPPAEESSAEESSAGGDAEATTGPDASAARDPAVWHLVSVGDVVLDLPAAYPEIVLHEAQHPWRELRIPVGLAEGTAIAYAFRSIAAPRPLTHDLFTEVIERHGVAIDAVRITARRGQAYLAEMDTSGPRGRQVMPCRPSDAIALALRQQLPVPILVAEWVFDSAEPTGEEG